MVESMIEEATVIAVRGNECIVRLRQTDEDRCRQCALCAAAAEDAEDRRILRVPLTAQAKVGATVRVEIRRPNTAILALVLFGMPMAGVGVGVEIGAVFARLVGCPSWIGMTIGAVILLLLAFVVAKGLERRWLSRGAFSSNIITDRDRDVGFNLSGDEG